MQLSASIDSSWDVCIDELEALPSRPIEERIEIVERLIRNPLPGIREQALRVGIAVLSDEVLIEYLRSDADAVVRNAGLEILKKKGSQSLPLALELLKDNDPDVALQAVLIVDHIGDPRALEPLRSVLRHEDTNIVQAAMIAIGHLGDRRVIPDLLPFLAQDLWLQMAAIQALGDLRQAEAIAPISELLGDLTVGSTAAEAIAQIGGPEAFAVLEPHWLAFRDTLDPESILGLLAHVLEGLEQNPDHDPRLRGALAEHLRDPYRGVRFAAARCLLALGAGAQDTEALSVLLADDPDSDVLPSCLARRSDLARTLLGKPFPLNAWGFLLCSLDRDRARRETSDALDDALRSLQGTHLPAPLLEALEALRLDACAGALLELYLNSRPVERTRLVPTLRANSAALMTALAEASSVSPEERTVLEAVLGHSTEATRKALLELSNERRPQVLRLMLDQPDLLRALPWAEWVRSRPELYLEIAARAAADSGLRELLPLLREAIRKTPVAGAIRAVGRLRDHESIEVILPICDQPDHAILRPVVIESLGRIGGPQARQALRDLAQGSGGIDSRLAYHALARCASEEDDECFREAAGSSDWYVRLAAVEALARFSRPANLRALAQLAADPVSIVAQKALAALRSQ